MCNLQYQAVKLTEQAFISLFLQNVFECQLIVVLWNQDIPLKVALNWKETNITTCKFVDLYFCETDFYFFKQFILIQQNVITVFLMTFLLALSWQNAAFLPVWFRIKEIKNVYDQTFFWVIKLTIQIFVHLNNFFLFFNYKKKT